MMIDPATFRHEYEDKTLEECYRVRRDIIDAICRYEDGDISDREKYMLPSPKTIYDMNNLNLKEICELIEEKLEVLKNKEDE